MTPVLAAMVAVVTAVARQHFAKPELQIMAFVAIGSLFFWPASQLLRQRKEISKRQVVIFAMLWLFGGALVVAVFFVARLLLPIEIHDLHAVTDRQYARWLLRGKGEPNAEVQVALELENGPFPIKAQRVSADGSFQVDVFGGNGFWVHPDMGLAVRQAFPNNPLVDPQDWIRSLAVPATPDEYLKRRPEPTAAARGSSRTVTWSAPQALQCMK